MSSEMSERAEREDDVWKFSNNNGVLVGADGMLYAYHKTKSYVYIDEVNGIGDDETPQSFDNVYQQCVNAHLDFFEVVLDFVSFFYIEDGNDYMLN